MCYKLKLYVLFPPNFSNVVGDFLCFTVKLATLHVGHAKQFTTKTLLKLKVAHHFMKPFCWQVSTRSPTQTATHW